VFQKGDTSKLTVVTLFILSQFSKFLTQIPRKFTAKYLLKVPSLLISVARLLVKH